MELLVETFKERQKAPQTIEDIESYNALVVDLGLEQMCIKKDRMSIEPMPQLEHNVYKALCPKKIDLKEYPHPIPVEVLKAMKESKSWFEETFPGKDIKYQVWVDEDPDPVLICKVGYDNSYLIGRWGNELQDFPTLLKRAKERVLAKQQDHISRLKSYYELYQRSPEAFAMACIEGNIGSLYFH